MRGAIAAGHPVTAEAGARILASGGNAVDAAIAACFASWTAESPLTGPGGGGFMLVHRARDRTTRVLDFFVTVPTAGVDADAMDAVDVVFDAESSQLFHVGVASVAVPGTTAGLAEAHRRYGSLPWRELVEPGRELAQDGVPLNDAQAYLHRILADILRQDDGHGLADTLAAIAEDGARAIYDGELGGAICAAAPHLTRADLAAYRVISRRPVAARFRNATFTSNPPPSSGGILIAYGLGLIERGADILETMRAQAEARDARFLRDLYRGGLARRLLTDAPSLTTHISVVDGDGNAASLSCSLGSGSGVFVPGTGIHLNNMLGEVDLAGTHRPGERLTSMMAPSICFEDERPRLVLGSAGSARLRGAIMQVVVNVLARGLDVRAAVDAPRVHLDDDGATHAEPGAGPADIEWRERNLYFGGVNAVELHADGNLTAAGDPRRGGASVVVA